MVLDEVVELLVLDTLEVVLMLFPAFRFFVSPINLYFFTLVVSAKHLRFFLDNPAKCRRQKLLFSLK